MPSAGTGPVRIGTDDPGFATSYSALSPQFMLYTLPDAMAWVAHRMKVGDDVVTRKADHGCSTPPRLEEQDYADPHRVSEVAGD
jgi:hypothetical protein